MRALVPCARGHARHRWRSGCEVGRDLHLSMPTRNYTAENYHRSIGLCRFHATPCARSSHARADMHAAAGEVDAKLEETIYRSSVLPSTAPCQCVITQPIFSQIILPLQIPCHTMRALVPRSRGHAAAGEVDAELEETIYRSSVLPSTTPCQCVITEPIFFTDHFAFADSMPHHARARPMPVLARTCYLPRALPCPHAADRTDPAAVSAG